MRLIDYFEPENENKLRELCVSYYSFLNEYNKRGIKPPPKEMAQKLKLHVDEYSEFLNFVNNGGYDSIVLTQFHEDQSRQLQ